MEDTYFISTRDYLERARKQLQANTLEALFYAAFNLRCGIESRMQEYLEPHEHISKKDKRSWNLTNLNKSCMKYFSDNQQIQKLEIVGGEEAMGTFYYIPVSLELLRNGQKLGNYMHSMKKFEKPKSQWWKNFRKLLNETYNQLEFCCKGALLGPMLHTQGEARSAIEFAGVNENLADKFLKGMQCKLKVSYFNIAEHTTLP